MEHLDDDLLACASVVLDDKVLDQIDKIVPPGTDVGPLEAAYSPPGITQASQRRRPGLRSISRLTRP
jgi:aryl-alcohol dehydrogenase (NADP+)